MPLKFQMIAQLRTGHSELPCPEGTLEVVLPLREKEKEGPEGMKRFCLMECFSLAGRLQFVPWLPA